MAFPVRKKSAVFGNSLRQVGAKLVDLVSNLLFQLNCDPECVANILFIYCCEVQNNSRDYCGRCCSLYKAQPHCYATTTKLESFVSKPIKCWIRLCNDKEGLDTEAMA